MAISDRNGGRSRGLDQGQRQDDEHDDVERAQLDHMRLLAMRKRHVQRKAARQAEAGARIPAGGGTPLTGELRARMEPQLGADLSSVKVHTGGDSATAAERLGARAFTTGSDVHFGAGEFAPGTKEGDRLIAHELTHAVQAQKSGIQRKADAEGDHAGDAGHGEHEVSQPGDPAEQEADAVADGVADNLHGDDQKSTGRVGKQAAPAIGAKLSGRKIFRAGKDPLKSGTKNALGTGPEVGGMRAGNRKDTGVVRAPRHHVFPQNAEDKAWFAARGVDVDQFCIVVDEGEHSAIHTMGWNPRVMADLKKAEKLKKGKGKLTLPEMLAIAKPLMVEFKIGGRPFVPFKGADDDGHKGKK